MKLIRLDEAIDFSFNERFKNTNDPQELRKIFIEFFTQNLLNNEDIITSFVDNNIDALTLEAQKYTLTTDNPFYRFLKVYLNHHNNIDPFSSTDENYAIIHDCVAKGDLSEKQLAWTCPENEQVRIIINPNLYKVSPKSDIVYLISVYTDVLDKNMNTFILNNYVKAAFSDGVQEKNGKLVYEKPDMNTIDNKINLLKTLFFSEVLFQLTSNQIGENILETVNKAKSKINSIDKNALVSTKFMNIDAIEHQVKILRELTQESKRDDFGRYQKTDTDKNNEKDSDNLNIDRRAINYYRTKLNDSAQALKKVFPDLNERSASQLKALLKGLYDSL